MRSRRNQKTTVNYVYDPNSQIKLLSVSGSFTYGESDSRYVLTGSNSPQVVSSSLSLTGALDVTGSFLLLGGFSSEGFFDVSGDFSATGSFEHTGSFRQVGGAEITGALDVNQQSEDYGLHIQSTGKASIFLEADTDNVTETDTAFIKLQQDGGVVAGLLGFNPLDGKDSENNDLEGALDNALYLGTTNARDLQLGTNSEIGLTMAAGSQRVGIGTTSPDARLDVSGSFVVGDGALGGTADNENHIGIRVGQNTDGATNGITFWENQTFGMSLGYDGSGTGNANKLAIYSGQSHTEIFRFDNGGDAYKPGGGSWSSLSDGRLKKNVKPLSSSLEKIVKLNPVSFEWAETGPMRRPGKHKGFIAQEVQQYFPEWVSTTKEKVEGELQEVLGVNLQGFEAVVVEALKELYEEVKYLRSIMPKGLKKKNK